MTASLHQVRKARAFLYSHHKRGFGIQPAKFAAASQELGANYRDLMHFISLQYARGAQQDLFRQQQLQQIAAKGGNS